MIYVESVILWYNIVLSTTLQIKNYRKLNEKFLKNRFQINIHISFEHSNVYKYSLVYNSYLFSVLTCSIFYYVLYVLHNLLFGLFVILYRNGGNRTVLLNLSFVYL